jgi:hypothetical protein
MAMELKPTPPRQIPACIALGHPFYPPPAYVTAQAGYKKVLTFAPWRAQIYSYLCWV